jgi:hypothetical protein
VTVQPIAVKVTRYQCPFCSRSGAVKARIRDHIGRCWSNPAAQACRTCRNFAAPEETAGEEYCMAGVDLSGQPACTACGGDADPWNEHPGCTGREVKPGPIVHCPKWEAIA